MNKKIIHTVFEQVVQDRGDKVAVEDQVSSCTYHELNRLANQLAYLILGMKLAKSSVIGAFLPPSVAFVAAQVGVWKSGHVYLPLTEQQPEEKLIKALIKCNPSVLIVSREHLDRVKDLLDMSGLKTSHILVADQLSFSKVKSLESTTTFPDTNPSVSIADDDPNYIYFTSGSTGDSKAIVGRHKSLSHFIHWEVATFQLNATVKIGFLNQTTFDASLRDIWVPLITGGTLFVPAAKIRDDYQGLMKWTAEKQINLMHTVPSIFRLLTKALTLSSGLSLSHVKYVLLAGESLYAKDIHDWRAVADNQATLVNLYGTSETTLAKTYYIVDNVPEESETIIPVGKPISNTVVAILNNGTPCALGEIGEIFIKTPFATGGYYQDEPLTKRVFVKNPLSDDPSDIIYKTGDLGRYQHDGNIEVLGRIDTQVKVNGIRIELEEVKRAILRLDAIREAEVLVHKNHFQHELVAYYTGKVYDVDEIRKQLSFLLNRSMIPTYFMHLDQLPLMINGKVDKKALPRPDKIVFNDASFEAPQGRTEEIIGKIWMNILNLSSIDRNTSFFKLGGTSLKAIQIISRLNRDFNISLRVIDIFNNSTLKRLAEVVYEKDREECKEIPPAPQMSEYPLSIAQKQLWMAMQASANPVLFNMRGAYKIQGDLRIEALKQAVSAIIERHESLRTLFVMKGGEPVQKILPYEEIKLRMIDTQSKDESEFNRIINEESNHHFQLSEEPSFRTALLKIEEQEYIFLMNMSHIISDGWSMEVIVRDLVTTYNALVQGQTPNLAPLPIQYKDFACWQHKKHDERHLNELRDYWWNLFEDGVPTLLLPTDFPRPEDSAYQGQSVQFLIEKAVAEKLKQIATSADLSLFMVLQGVVITLLYKLTGQKDIVLGSPYSGRAYQDLENQVGFYLNIVPFKHVFDAEDSFRQVLSEIKQSTLAALKHASYPYARLVEELKTNQHGQGPNLFNVMVQMQDAELEGNENIEMQGLKVDRYLVEDPTSKYDLTFNFTDDEGVIHAYLEYDTDLFKHDTIVAFLDDFNEIVQRVSSDSGVTLIEIRKQLNSAPEPTEDDFAKILAQSLDTDY